MSGVFTINYSSYVVFFIQQALSGLVEVPHAAICAAKTNGVMRFPDPVAAGALVLVVG
jgi:hypothetical protein